MPTVTDRARKVFRTHGGMLRTTDALAAGIHPRTLYAMRDAVEIETLTRGVYRLLDLAPMANPDLANRIKNGIELAKPDMATSYTQGPEGYTDYPPAA